jgi:hypothetical protein
MNLNHLMFRLDLFPLTLNSALDEVVGNTGENLILSFLDGNVSSY